MELFAQILKYLEMVKKQIKYINRTIKWRLYWKNRIDLKSSYFWNHFLSLGYIIDIELSVYLVYNKETVFIGE